MFGFVMANLKEVSKEEQRRYSSVYCGVCRRLRLRCSRLARLGLSYDITFLVLLLMSLYEPEETAGKRACHIHPIRPRAYTDCEILAYGADMNIALAYYNALDDVQDEGKAASRLLCRIFGKKMDTLREIYLEKCRAIEMNLEALARLEKENCPDPDRVAACFGALLGELFVWQDDIWADTLRNMGDALGRFIYLADSAVDYHRDKEKGNYNPFVASGKDWIWEEWEQILVLCMQRCTTYFEKLPLVQDKGILDNILYSGVWLQYRQKQRRQTRHQGGNQ